MQSVYVADISTQTLALALTGKNNLCPLFLCSVLRYIHVVISHQCNTKGGGLFAAGKMLGDGGLKVPFYAERFIVNKRI